MSDVCRQTTDEQRALLETAKQKGGICGACGRTLGPEDTVWIERFWVGTKLFADPETVSARIYWEAPVGVECAAPAFVARKEGEEPAACVRCGRGIYYDVERWNRGQAFCSASCRSRRQARSLR